MNSFSPKSPCVGVCSLGPQGFCLGCFRTLDEITGWMKMTVPMRWEVIEAARAREAAAPPRPEPPTAE